MAVIGRTFRPVINEERCNTCSICTQQCPAYVDAGYRQAEESVRGRVFRSFGISPPPQITPIDPADPPCQMTCPIHQDVRGYLKAVAEGRHADAVALIRETNPLPLVCGTICPHPCEMSCLRGTVDIPVGIRAVKRFAALYEKRHGLKPDVPSLTTGKKVAIIGSGPAGIAAAYFLVRHGVQPIVFEKTSRIGGMLAWAIPAFRLPRDILTYEFELLTSLGIEFRTNQDFGSKLSLDNLKNDGFDAILLAIGTTRGDKVSLEGEEEFENHLDCLTCLFAIHRGESPNLGNAVVVIGGGNAAIDTARVLKRSGVADVTIVYRRPRDQMPADREEVAAAEKEGISFLFSALPTRLSKVGSTWRLTGFETRSVARNTPVEILRDTPFELPVTGIISAISQLPETSWAEKEKIAVHADGTLQVDDTLTTSREGVFAAGDAVTGPSTVVEAMASGQAAAESIIGFLKGGNVS